MTTLVRDSYDFYSSINDITAIGQNTWDAANPTSANFLSAIDDPTYTRFGVGRSIRTGNSSSGTDHVTKNWSTITDPVFIGTAWRYNDSITTSTTNAGSILFYDGATVQMRINFVANGNITVYRGDNGTLLATFTSAFTQGVWTQWQIKAIIATGTSGEVHFRKNGNTVDDYSITGVNTANSGVSQTSGVRIQGSYVSGGGNQWDDTWIWSGDATYPNDWLGDFRAVQLQPNSDVSTGLTPNGTLAVGPTGTTGTRSCSTGTMYTISQIEGRTGTLSKITLYPNAAMTGNCKVALYAPDGTNGAPGTYVGESNVVTNPTAALTDFTFASAPTLTPGTRYWIALLTSATLTLKDDNTNITYYTQSQTYAGGFPATFTGSTGNAHTAYCVMTYTSPPNAAYAQERSEDGSATYVYSATVGATDLYGSAGLPVTPTAILGVSLRGFLTKSDSGARQAAMTMTSGATSLDGSSFVLGTSFQYVNMVQDTDPNTGLAWSVSGVNNLKFGVKVTA